MISPFSPADKADRVELLRSAHARNPVLDTALERISRLAVQIFQVPMALVALVDGQKCRVISQAGLDLCDSLRLASMCEHANRGTVTMIVTDALLDPRFYDDPMVVGPPHIRFYAGRPLLSSHGLAIGTLCLIDQQPRLFSATDEVMMNDLAELVEEHLERSAAAAKVHPLKISLEQSELLFARTVIHAAVGIAVSTTDGRWLEVNQRFCDIVGHAREQLIGASVADIVYLADLDIGRTLLRRVLRGESSAVDLEMRFVRADGSFTWTQVGASVLLDEHGDPENLITVVTDIDLRKHIQHELESLQRTLEERIEARTTELSEAMEKLKGEMAIRESVQRALTQQKERFESTLSNASDAFIEADRHGRIVSWNQSAERIFGWSRSEVLGRSVCETIVPPTLRNRYQEAFQHGMQEGISDLLGKRLELTGLRRNGEVLAVELTLGTSTAGGEQLVNAFLQDISRRKTDEHSLRESAQLLKTITDNAPGMIAFIDSDLRYRFHNRAYTDWFGIPPNGLVGTDAREFWGPAAYEKLRPTLTAVLRGDRASVEYQLTALAGPIWFYAHLVPHAEEDGSVTGFYILAQDVTERKQLYDRIEYESTHDALTGLANRRGLMRQLNEAMVRAHKHGRPLAVLFMDLDGFKHMNDLLGHEFGDAVLQHFAATVTAAVRETDFVARLAGDEFVVVLEDIVTTSGGDVGNVARTVLERLRTDQIIEGVAVILSASFGAAVHTDQDEETAQELLHRADAAMYRAKAAGKRQLSF